MLDRTKEFEELRQQQREPFLRKIMDHSAFVETKEYFLSEIQKLSLLSTQINELHMKILLEEKTENIQQVLNKKQDEFIKLSLEIKKDLIAFGNEMKTMDASNTAITIHKNCFELLLTKFTEEIKKYETQQSHAKNKLEQKMVFSYRVLVPEATEQEAVKAIQSGTAEHFVDRILDKKHSAAVQSLAYIETRHNDILLLEKEITELHSLFMDMALLTGTSSEMTEVVQKNVEKTLSNVESGTKELRKARIHQKKSRKCMFCFLCIILLILLVIAIPLIVVLSNE